MDITMWADIYSRYWMKMLECHQRALTGGIYPRSLRVALLVGTLLNLINQPEAFLGLAPWNPAKMLLTYAVPFLVATYGAVINVPGTTPVPPLPIGEPHDPSH
jgi:hypothetical protein